MRAGDLRNYVAFKTASEAEDGLGGITQTWATTFSDWVAIWPLSANENVENLRVGADITHRVRMRYRSGVLHKMRVVWGTRTLEVKSVINKDERNHTLDLICVELDAS